MPAAAARAHARRVAFLGVEVQDFKSDARDFLRQVSREQLDEGLSEAQKASR